MNHFLLKEGHWKGLGIVSFSHSHETLSFTMRWDVEEKGSGCLLARQEVTVEELEPRMNFYRIALHQEGVFHLLLSNDTLEDCTGYGSWDEKKIEWHFQHPGVLDGFECYELLNKGEYRFASAYGQAEGLVTKISGTMEESKVSLL